MRGLLILAAAAVPVAGCMTMEERRVAYDCERGDVITIVFAGETARLLLPGEGEVVMQQRPSGSGFWYEAATHSIRGQGTDLIYTIGRMAPMNCTAIVRQPR